MNIVDNYSGIVLNQNQKPALATDYISISDGLMRYQEVFLPDDYTRGEGASRIIPPLSGWQILVGIDPDAQTTAQLKWTAEYRIFGVGWVTLASGTTTGVHSEGDQVWMDLPFDKPVDLNDTIIENRFRFGFQNLGGINKVWFSNPNPLALKGFAKLVAADGSTAIQSEGNDVSILFRVLSLIADDGTDFLGNPFRSAVRSNVSGNTSIAGEANNIYVSEPAPSRFAVKSLYYDVRAPAPKRYGKINRIKNGSFETGLTTDWLASNAVLSVPGGTPWAARGSRSMRVTGTTVQGGAATGVIPVVTGRDYAASAILNVTSYLSSGVRFMIHWYDLNSVYLGTTLTANWATGTGIKYINIVAEAMPNASQASVEIYTSGAGSSFDFSVDAVIFTEGEGIPEYRDGDDVGWQWTGDPHNSTSVEVIEGTLTDEQVVIDNVLVDPVTTGVWFSIYHSSEGERPETEEEWENKLWTKVPGSFQALKRESHKLPAPIVTKYVKIEFTHLQAKSYNPGDFAKPVSYKKHPKWILDYFLVRIAAEKELNDRLAFGRVAVIYDALDLAYNYYLDDLRQEPEEPVQNDANFDSTLAFVDRRDDKSDVIDASVLARINLSMAPYKDLPSVFTKDNYLLGELMRTIAPDAANYPVEMGPTERADIAPLRNAEVVQESDYPVMFFYLTCRHKYREVTAPFSHDRAYFVGIREIAFTRERYAVEFDNDRYVEPAGDLFNIERNDFDHDDGVLVV